MTRAHAAAAHAPPTLFEALGAAAASLPPSSFGTAAVADIALAFASVGVAPPELFDTLAAAAVHRRRAAGGYGRFTPHTLSSLAWAFAAADHTDGTASAPPSELFGSDFSARLEEVGKLGGAAGGFTADQLGRLHQWQLWHGERGLTPPLSPDLAKRSASAFASACKGAKPSAGVSRAAGEQGAGSWEQGSREQGGHRAVDRQAEADTASCATATRTRACSRHARAAATRVAACCATATR